MLGLCLPLYFLISLSLSFFFTLRFFPCLSVSDLSFSRIPFLFVYRVFKCLLVIATSITSYTHTHTQNFSLSTAIVILPILVNHRNDFFLHPLFSGIYSTIVKCFLYMNHTVLTFLLQQSI